MHYDASLHHRRNLRLKDYDYTQAGAYFITLCTQNREHLFGSILNGVMQLNPAGKMVETIWREIPAYYKRIFLDEFIIMPNHLHGIVILEDTTGYEDERLINPSVIKDSSLLRGQPQGAAPTKRLSLPDVVHRFKTMTTKRYADGVKQSQWLPFQGKLWQRNYWEHVIRNHTALAELREYICNNPLRWEEDLFNKAECQVVSSMNQNVIFPD